MKITAIENCKKAQNLIALSESVESLLSDSDIQSNQNKAIYKATARILSSDDVAAIRENGGASIKRAFEFDRYSTPSIDLLLELELRPVNDLARKFYHQPIIKIIGESKQVALSNNENTAMIRISRNNDAWDVIQVNSMNDSIERFDFNSIEEIFEQFLHEFYVLLNREQANEILDNFKEISSERKSRPCILNKITVRNVS